MPGKYIVKRSDPALAPIEILPATQDTSTSLTFVGYRFPVYGEALWTNVLRMLENFAAPLPPRSPITGQIWMDTTTSPGVPKVYNKQGVWEVIGAGLTVGATPPSVPGVIDPLYPPDLWFDDSTNSLKYWDQALNSWVGINCTVFASQLEYNALVDELTVVGAALGLIVPTNKIITTAGSPNTPPTTSQWQLLFIGVQTIIAHIRDTNAQSGTPATNAAYWIEAYNTIAAIVASGEDFKWCPTGTSSLHGMSTYFEIFDFVYATCTRAKSWATSPNLALPNAVDFVLSSTTAVPGQTITCTSTTSGATSWLWNFGNGVSSNLEGPHILSYPNPGTYTITLTASNSTSVGTATDVLTSYAKPVSSFNTIGPVVGIPPLSVTFIDTSTNNPTNWGWTVTNHDTSAVVTTATTQNFQYSATTNGVYDISLVASNQAGASINTATTQVITTTSPIASFTRTPTAAVAQPPLTVNFTDTSSNSPTSWLWDFGDGATSTVQSPSHTYTTAGLFTVSLTVTNTVASNTVTVPACVQTVVAPIANFTYSGATSGSTPLTLAFADTSANSPTSWLWNFGDGATSSIQSPSHTYTTNGVFTVTLIATNAAGSSTKISSNIVNTQFVASITLATDEYNVNIRSKLIAAGWNGLSPVFGSLTINTGVVIGSTSIITYAMRTGGSFPTGSDFAIINYGYVTGCGGSAPSGVGGPALLVDATTATVSISNYGTIGGGGGGGGSGGGGYYTYSDPESGISTWSSVGGGGGGGAGYNPGAGGGTVGGGTALYAYYHGASVGSGGSTTVGGSGGSGSYGHGAYVGPNTYIVGGAGGAGGGLGATGGGGGSAIWAGESTGSASVGSGSNGIWAATANAPAPTGGGAGGACVTGNTNVAWVVPGTRLGTIV